MLALLCVAAAQRLFTPHLRPLPRASTLQDSVPTQALQPLRSVVPVRHKPPEASLPEIGQDIVIVLLQGLALYQGVITLRILLSWFPQAMSIGFLQPIFYISDAYLNLFRGIIPPIGGLDLSPILAFFVLNYLQSSLGALLF